MADNSSNNSSGPRNWRDRIGVKGGMPKLADEFKSEPEKSVEKAPDKPVQPARREMDKPQSAKTQGENPKRPAPKPLSRPAPMAPRRRATDVPATPAKPAENAATERGTEFAERLRAQREAAETLAKKRSDETRDRLADTSATSSTTGRGPRFSFAKEEIKAAAKENPVQPPAPRPAVPARPTPPPPPPSASPADRPSESARQGDRRAQNSPPSAYQPSNAYRQTQGYRDFEERRSTPAEPPATPAHHERYAEPSTDDRRRYTPPARDEYRAPSSRDPYYADDAADDLFEDGAQTPPLPPRRAGASDYSAAYRDYDEAFDYNEEPRSRGGIWVFVVLMLIVVAAIAAGAYWFINYGTKIGSTPPATGKVPTVTAPEQPVKVAPKPADTTPTPGAPVRRKKIYDRILGNQTLEPEKLVPSEEAPKTPPPAAVPEAAPAGDAPSSVQPLPLPLPPPPTIPGVQGGIMESAPGALPGKSNRIATTTRESVVPQSVITKSVPPGTAKSAQTIIAPTAAPQKTSKIQTGGQQAPLTLPPPASAPEQPVTPVVPQVAPPELPAAVVETQTGSSPPLPRKKPAVVIARARQAAEQTRQAADRARLAKLARSAVPAPVVPTAPRQPLTGTGPVQLAPGSSGTQNFNTGSAPAIPAPGQANTNIASLPQPSLPPPVPQQPVVTGSGYVLQMSSFRNRNAASAEYRRLISRHASVLRGLSPEIQEANLGASGKFYKLRLGSVASRGQAAQLCNALIAAGEKDCLVRSR